MDIVIRCGSNAGFTAIQNTWIHGYMDTRDTRNTRGIRDTKDTGDTRNTRNTWDTMDIRDTRYTWDTMDTWIQINR